MRSKTSYFNPTLFKKNLTRFWPLWGGASVIAALIPLYALTELIQDGFRSHAGEGLVVTQGYYYGLTYAVPVISLIYAALCALAVWHYLYNARSVGFCHSLPITRKGLFITNFLSGMAMMLMPYVAAGTLAVLITLAAGLLEPVGVLVTVLGVIGESFFYFATATLIVFITGNPFAFAAFYFIFHFLAVGAEWLVAELISKFYFGVYRGYEGVAAFLSPTVYFFDKMGAHAQFVQIPTAGGWTERGDIEFVTLRNGWLIAVYALVGVVLLGCAWALYQRRRSESAGDVVAVGWMKPVFRYGVALCAAVSGGTLLYNLFCESFQTRTTANAVPMAVCMAIAGLIGYYIASMLLAKSLAVFRRSGRGAALTVVASIAVCCLIAADPFGVESWVPKAGEMAEAYIHVYTSRRDCAADLTDPAAIEKVLDFHRAIVAEADSLDRQDLGDSWGETYVQVHLSYFRQGGERYPVIREYTLPVTEESLAQSEVIQKGAALVSDPAIQEENIFSRVKRRADEDEARLTGGYLNSIYNTESGKFEVMDLTVDQSKTLEDAIRRDIQAGHFGKTVFLPYKAYTESGEMDRAGKLNQMMYDCDISLYYNIVWKMSDGQMGHYSSDVTVTLSTYCTETLKALEEIGVVDAAHKFLTVAERYAMENEENDGDIYGDIYKDDFDSPASYVYTEEAF